MENLSALEQAVLDKLLAGSHPILATLRAQAEKAHPVGRELSGVGFFCSFDVPLDAPSLEGLGDFQIDDVNAVVDGLAHGAGFVLFIRDGRLDMLEGFSYDEAWPENVRHFTLTYQSEPRELSLPGLSPSAERP